MAEPALTNVFAFTAKRDEVARFFEEVLGLRRDEPPEWGFVPWFHVDDLAKAFELASARSAAVGAMRDGYFLARDPDGRVFGVRRWR